LLNSGCGVEYVWHEPIEDTRAAWRVTVFLNRSCLAGGNAAILGVVQVGTKLFMEMSVVSYQLSPVLHEFLYSLNGACRLMCLVHKFFSVWNLHIMKHC